MKNKGIIVGGLLVLVVVAVVLVFALGKGEENETYTNKNTMSHNMGTTSTNSGQTQPVETTSVKIADFSFSPATIKVKVGQSVTWTNQDTVSHSIIADTESADAPKGPLMAEGQSYSFTFNKAGTYAYHCGVHPSMKGTVIVE